ncbi:unnamed protein product, partial [marine sediment metagenome]
YEYFKLKEKSWKHSKLLRKQKKQQKAFSIEGLATVTE